MEDIPSTIRALRSTKYSDFTPYEINDGLCERFARDVLENHPEAEECSTGLIFKTEVNYKYPIHVWVYANGRHYDAESPSGVESFRSLPFWERQSVEIPDAHLVEDSPFLN